MVTAVRRGQSVRRVARRFGVSKNTVQLWVDRAGRQRLDRVDFGDHPAGCPTPVNRTKKKIESLILSLRKHLKDKSDLGEYGAAAIRREMIARKEKKIPSLRTIGRILLRNGALDGRKRVRRAPPPRGWYLGSGVIDHVELDSIDTITDLVIRGGTHVTVLNVVSQHGGLCASWPRSKITAKITVELLLAHWKKHGLSEYAKFDNDTVFQGAHQWPDSFGRVIRLCLSLGVTPIFSPPRETGFQADIEAFNGQWQRKVWQRFEHPNLRGLTMRSDRFTRAANERNVQRIDNAPTRRPLPGNFKLDLSQPLTGTIIYLRRTNDQGQVKLLGRTWLVSQHWVQRLVRIEVSFDQKQIRFYALRRREPIDQPLLKKIKYTPPIKPFKE